MNAKTIIPHYFILVLLVVFYTGCYSKTAKPIGRLDYHNPAAYPENRKLLVFLRGLGGGNEVFERQGLVKEVIDRKLPFDMVAPDAHYGYYKEENLWKRLHEDIILPARRQGYREIWLAGTSMGGLGALMYLTQHSTAVDGVILLSPFLGGDLLVEEISEAGGLANWEPGPYSTENWERYLWAWIKQYALRPEKHPPIYLGYGDWDFFIKPQELLGTILKQDHIVIVDGWHTYATLRKLWPIILDRLQPILLR